jgi:hypothetical protein
MYRTTDIRATFDYRPPLSPNSKGHAIVTGFFGGSTIYLHYLTRGRLVKTVRLGSASGLCHILVTPRRPIFPFRARRGVGYTTIFDTSPRGLASNLPVIDGPELIAY